MAELVSVNLDIIRDHNGSSMCLGSLFIDGELVCNTLERPVYSNRKGIDAIPSGTYVVVLATMSSKPAWGLLPLILGVTDRDGIFMHVANCPHQLRGCIALGMGRSNKGVYSSAKAVSLVVAAITGKKCVLTIKDCSN